MYYDIIESGKRIKGLRKGKGFTQESLAEAMGMSAKTIASLETGNRGTTIDTLVALADVLGATLDYIVLGRGQTVLGIEIPEGKKEFALKMLKAILENM